MKRLGALAAAEALARGPLTGVSLPGDPGLSVISEDVHELLAGLPPVNTNAQGVVAEGTSSVPVLATCEVLVIGAGTAGAPAAISSGRAGADTLVVEFLYNMGGVQTDGRIGRYYHGNICGFTVDDVDPGVSATGSVLATSKSEWYRQACRETGVRILYGTLAAGALVDGTDLKGVVVVLPDGRRGVIRADAVVDATGNALVAAAAGEETTFIKADEVAVQGSGQARHLLGDSYRNSDVGFVDDRDVADLFFFARRAYASMTVGTTWDAGQNPASRERRRLVGVVTVDPVDILNGRTWPDTIVRPRSNFDSHGFTVHDLFFVRDPGTADETANLPYRALLPKTLDGLLVSGLGISAHRDAMPILRMQPDVQNQGYAAGYAAALAVQNAVTLRNVDMSALQDHLIAKGILEPADKGTPDSFPLGSSAIQSAVNGLTNDYATLHTVLTDVDTALPMLRTAYAAQSDPALQLIYAHVLGLLYDPTGVDTLAAAVSAGGWDTGWNYRGMGQYGLSVSQMDSYIIAMGRTLNPAGISPVLAKASLLTGSSYFSHIRAVSFALENLDGGSSISALSGLLGEVEGYALTNSLVAPVIQGYSDTVGDTERNNCLKEISVARALFKLGDDLQTNGSRVLSDYAVDPREVYASHARLVLENGSSVYSSDGTWTATDLAADWNNPGNWKNGQPASGMGSTAFFTNAVPGTQTISLNSDIVNVGSLIFSGVDRVLTHGILDISAEPPSVDVAEGTRITMKAEVLSGAALNKTGAGTLEVAGAATLSGLDLTEGAVVLSDPDAQFYRAYAANTNDHNSSSVEPLTLRCDFRVNEALMITELGAYDSAGDGFESFKKVAVYNLGGGAPLEALAFSPEEDYVLEGGYRFRQLPEPLVLQPGDYSIVTYGFSGSDRYIVGAQSGVGAQVGTLENGGVLSFLTNAFSSVSGALSYPTGGSIGPASDYAVSAGSFRFVTGAQSKNISAPVTVASGTTLDVAAVKMIFEQGLTAGAGGLGIVSNASAAHAVSLTFGVPAGTTNTMAGSAIGHRDDGPLTLVKEGAGELSLTGPLGFDGGLCVKSGPLTVDSPASLGAGDLSFGTGGRLRLLAGGTLDRTLYVANQSDANNHSSGLELAGGETLTLTGGMQAPRTYEYGGFVIQPFDNGAGLTRVVMDGTLLGYFDLYLQGDGPDGTGAAEHEWIGVRGGLRKLASGNETTTGSRIAFGTGCDFSANWFDIAGSNAVVTVTNNANIRVTSQLRFVDGNDSQLSLDGGTFGVRSFGVANVNNQHLSLKPVLFNGTWIQALADNDLFFDLSMSSAAPLICNGGALFNTDGYDVAIRGKGFAQQPDSTGVFVKDGSGTLKIATPMSYTGLTVVSNGVLSLDFGLWQGNSNSAENLLPPSNSVWCADGAALRVAGITNAAGEVTQRQSLARVESAVGTSVQLDITEAGLTLSELDGSYVKTGDGILTVTVGNEGVSLINGTLNVQQGVFELQSPPLSMALNIPYPSFESDPLLPADPISSKDKRGAQATGCPGWTFTVDAGYQRNNSYFSGTAVCYAPDGIQTAFLMRNGAMNTTLEILTNGVYTLTFQYCPRYFSSVWYANHILHVNLDGEIMDTFTVTEHSYIERTVVLGELTPGSHTLSISGVDPIPTGFCTLIDLVSVTGTTGFQGTESLSSENWHLSVDAQGQIALNYSGLVTLSSLTINGEPYSGVYVNATTHPGLVTGSGTLRINQSGLIFILR